LLSRMGSSSFEGEFYFVFTLQLIFEKHPE
jgi:hypothetical protein